MATVMIYSRSPKTLDEKIKYISDKKKNTIFGGYGVSDDPEIACVEMKLAKFIYDKYDRRMFLEIVVSFDEYESEHLDVVHLANIAFDVCNVLPQGFQIFYGIHLNDVHQKHIHFAINTVSCCSQVRKLDIDPDDLILLKCEISKILMRMGLKPALFDKTKDLMSRYKGRKI